MSYTLGSTWRLPKDWETISLKEITSEWKGGAPFKPDDFTEEGFAVLHKGAIQKNGVVLVDPRKKTFTTAHYAKAHSKSVIDQSYMAVTLRDLVPSAPSIGLIADLAHSSVDEYILAQGAYGFKIDRNRVHPSYLVWLSNYEPFRKHMKRYAVGSTQVHIRTPVFQNITIPLPPLEKQKRIAAILDKADAVRRKRKKAIALTEELLRSTFLDMFGDPVTNPKGWKVHKLNELTSKIGSGATPKGGKSSYKSEGITLIRSMKVYDYLFEYEGLAFIDNQQAKALNNVVVSENDVLLNITGASVARCTIVPSSLIPARVNQHVAIIRTKNDLLNSYYLLCLINSKSFKKKLLSIANNAGATREALTKENLQKLLIPLPEVKIQNQFSDIYKKISQTKKNLYSSIEESETLFNSLLQKAFRGEL